MWELWGMLLIVGIFVISYFVLRPQKGDPIAMSDMRERLESGDDVITMDGICGKIIAVTKDDHLLVEIGEDQEGRHVLEVTRKGIRNVKREMR